MQKHLYAVLLTLTSFYTFAIDSVNVATYQPYLSEDPEGQALEYFMYDAVTEKYVAQKDVSQEQTAGLNGDPLFFYLSANKSEVSVGEEVEITITIRRPGIHPGQMFTFDHLLDYKVGLILPEGFILTSGQRAEFEGSFKNKSERVQEYKIKGYFEYIQQGQDISFKLLRGKPGLRDQIYVKKATLSLHRSSTGNRKMEAGLRPEAACDLPYVLVQPGNCDRFSSGNLVVVKYSSSCTTISEISSSTSVVVENNVDDPLDNQDDGLDKQVVIKDFSTSSVSFKLTTPLGSTVYSYKVSNYVGPIYAKKNESSVNSVGLNEEVVFEKSSTYCLTAPTVTWNVQGDGKVFVSNVYEGAAKIGEKYKFTQSGSKTATYTCTNSCGEVKTSNPVTINVRSPSQESISITATNSTLCGSNSSSTLSLIEGSSCNSKIMWKKGTVDLADSSLRSIEVNSTGTYYAYCKTSGLTSNGISIAA